MTYPENNPPEPNVLPGYFSPAEAPHNIAPVPPPVNPYRAPDLQYGSVQSGSVAPRSVPLYPARPVQAVGRFFRKYATFSGRASRSEFWWVQLFMAAVFLAYAFLNSVVGDVAVTAYVLFLFACIVPGLSLTTRRLHDVNLHGGLTALVLVPYVGVLVVAVLALLPSSARGFRFDKHQAVPGPFGQQHH